MCGCRHGTRGRWTQKGVMKNYTICERETSATVRHNNIILSLSLLHLYSYIYTFAQGEMGTVIFFLYTVRPRTWIRTGKLYYYISHKL